MKEITAGKSCFLSLDWERHFLLCTLERDRCVQEIICRGEFDLLIPGDQRKVLQVHVLVANQKAEQSSFKEFHALKGWKGAKLLDYACDFLHRRIVLGFAALATERRKILDRQAVPALPLKTLNKVREQAVNRAEQTVDRHLDADRRCHPHGEILV